MENHIFGEGKEQIVIRYGTGGPEWKIGTDERFSEGGGAHNLEDDFAREILRLAERVKELEARIETGAAGTTAWTQERAKIATTANDALAAAGRTERLPPASAVRELAARLARLDALLESEEAPEGLVKAILGSTGSLVANAQANRSWRWIKDFLRGPIDDPIPKREPDPAAVQLAYERFKKL